MFQDAAEVRCPITVQLHTATTAVLSPRFPVQNGLVRLQKVVVIVDTECPVIATYSQQCLFRRPYPVGSFAGGRVLGCVEPSARQTTSLLKLGEKIVAGGPAERLAAWVDFYGELDVDVNWLELQLGNCQAATWTRRSKRRSMPAGCRCHRHGAIGFSNCHRSDSAIRVEAADASSRGDRECVVGRRGGIRAGSVGRFTAGGAAGDRSAGP